jgi:GGDEF domain-containing protein
MVRLAQERVLLIGDPSRQVHAAIAQALPEAHVTSVASYFDAIAELAANNYTAVVAAAEPIERRPEAAVRQIRELAGEGRVVLFGHPTLELLSRKMLEFGADDYLITPASSGEIEQIFRAPPPPRRPARPGPTPEHAPDVTPEHPSRDWLGSATLAEVMLDALVNAPGDPIPVAIKRLTPHLPEGVVVTYQRRGSDAPHAPDEVAILSEPVEVNQQEVGTVHVLVSAADDAAAADDDDDDEAQSMARAALPRLASLFAKLAAVQDRHNTLHRAAITDDLTGVYNARYFRVFLAGLLEKARTQHFPVTLLLFDIDDFKKYNDTFGHGVGDEILKQTAALMRQCTREHDVVARIGGDEFAVVFWDKEGPRKPHDPKAAPVPHRPPQSPEQVFNRFKRLLADEKFPVLGPSGQGTLGISAGMAVYPYEAQDAAGLIREADNRLMHGAKKRGKNTLVIVGADGDDGDDDDAPNPPELSKG